MSFCNVTRGKRVLKKGGKGGGHRAFAPLHGEAKTQTAILHLSCLHTRCKHTHTHTHASVRPQTPRNSHAVKQVVSLGLLVDDGVDADGGLTRLTVTDHQLTLSTPDGDQGVHSLQAGLRCSNTKDRADTVGSFDFSFFCSSWKRGRGRRRATDCPRSTYCKRWGRGL